MRCRRAALAISIALALSTLMALSSAYGAAGEAHALSAGAAAGDKRELNVKPAVPDRYTHRPIVELFTGLWCSYCMRYMHPALDRYYKNDWEPEAPDHPSHIIEFHYADELATRSSEDWARRRGIRGYPTYLVDLTVREEGAHSDAYWRLKVNINSAGDDEVDPVVLLVEQRREGLLFNITVRMKYVGLGAELPVILFVFMTEDHVKAWSSYLGKYTTCRFVFRGFAIKDMYLTLPRGEWVETWVLWHADNVENPSEVHAIAVLYEPGGRAIASACDECSAHDMADEQAPVINGPYRTPSEVEPGREVDIAAYVTDDTGVLSVLLAYKIGDGDWKELAMSWNGSAYVATIGPFEAGETVTYKVMAYDIPGNLAYVEDSFVVGGKAEGDDQPPVIDAVWTEPAKPGPSEPFYVYVMAHDEGPSGIASVAICFSADGQDMCVLTEQVNATTWRAEIPGQPAGSTLVIHITVIDNAGNKAEDTLTLTIKPQAGGAGGGGGAEGTPLDTGLIIAIAIPAATVAVIGVLVKMRG